MANNGRARRVVWLAAGMLLAVHAALGLAAIGVAGAPPDSHAVVTPFDVAIAGFAFTPQVITVPLGSTVRWSNADVTTHTTTSDLPGWDSGELGSGATFMRAFTQPGSFDYHCTLHPFMLGTVKVLPLTVCPSGCGYTQIQAAIDDAPPGAVISVTAGVYTETLSITKSLTLLGGFTSNAFAARDVPTATSGVVGDNLRSAIAITGPADVRLDGFAVSHGRGRPFGGGVRSVNANLIFASGVVSGNLLQESAVISRVYGAGIFAQGGSAAILDSRFSGNHSACTVDCPGINGGGVALSGTLAATITGSLFEGNQAWVGGGIAAFETNLLLAGNRFESNASAYGGGLAATGGVLNIRQNIFTSNVGGAEGGGVRVGEALTLTVAQNVFTGNQAGAGGAIMHRFGVFSMTNNLIANNRATFNGAGGLETWTLSGAQIVHNTFADNLAPGTYGGLRILGPAAPYTLANTIFYSHAIGISTTAGVSVLLTHNAFAGNGQDWAGPAGFTVVGNLVGVNPGFVAAPVNYHLRASSALRDAGDPAFGLPVDFEGEARSSPPDIGADEAGGFELFLPLIRR